MLACVFDTETTGLIDNRLRSDDKQPEIVDIYVAIVDLDKGEILEEFDTLLKPKKWSAEAAKVHKIAESSVANAPIFCTIANSFIEMVQKSDSVIAHNLSFDMEMVEIELDRCDRKILWPRLICTVEQTIHLLGRRMGLQELHKFLFREEFAEAHRAKTDTQALIRSCIELNRRGFF